MPTNDSVNQREGQALLDSVHEELRESFMQSMPARLTEIRRIAESLRQSPPDAEALQALHAETHRLAGTTAVYGLKATSEVARRFNRVLRDGIQSGISTLNLDHLQAFLLELDAALRRDA
jgi:chemotaxis protein histidine kinase CheA